MKKIKFFTFYFKTQFFFWIDAGYFRDINITNYINNWPSINKCKQEPRVVLNRIRKIGKEEYEKLMSFDNITHLKFQNDANILGNAYGGRTDYLLKFIKYYYDIFRLFMKKNKFIGMDQNFYAIISYLHPEIVKIVDSNQYHFLKTFYHD